MLECKVGTGLGEGEWKAKQFSFSLGKQMEGNVKLVELKLDLKNFQSTKFSVEILYRDFYTKKTKTLSYICPSRIDENVGSSSLRLCDASRSPNLSLCRLK